MPFDYEPPPAPKLPPHVFREKGGVDRYRRMKVVRDKALARVEELEIALAAMTRDRDRLVRTLADHTHGDPL